MNKMKIWQGQFGNQIVFYKDYEQEEEGEDLTVPFTTNRSSG